MRACPQQDAECQIYHLVFPYAHAIQLTDAVRSYHIGPLGETKAGGPAHEPVPLMYSVGQHWPNGHVAMDATTGFLGKRCFPITDARIVNQGFQIFSELLMIGNAAV